MRDADDTLTFRDVSDGEDTALFDLFKAVRSEELQLAGWEPAARDHMLRLQFEAQRHGYRAEYPAADERLIVRGGVPIGWVIVDRTGPHLHGIDIALLADQRSSGLGTRIIRALQEEAAASGRPMVITVQRFNVRALALYERLGFRVVRETDVHIVMEWRRE